MTVTGDARRAAWRGDVPGAPPALGRFRRGSRRRAVAGAVVGDLVASRRVRFAVGDAADHPTASARTGDRGRRRRHAGHGRPTLVSAGAKAALAATVGRRRGDRRDMESAAWAPRSRAVRGVPYLVRVVSHQRHGGRRLPRSRQAAGRRWTSAAARAARRGSRATLAQILPCSGIATPPRASRGSRRVFAGCSWGQGLEACTALPRVADEPDADAPAWLEDLLEKTAAPSRSRSRSCRSPTRREVMIAYLPSSRIADTFDDAHRSRRRRSDRSVREFRDLLPGVLA